MKTRAFVAILALAALLLAGCGGSGGSSSSNNRELEREISRGVAKHFSDHKQDLFYAFHPIGTATSVRVHAVEIHPVGFDVMFTIYWQGPITTDGYTKVVARYDAQVERFTHSQILATNGISNAEAQSIAFDIGYAIGSSWGQ